MQKAIGHMAIFATLLFASCNPDSTVDRLLGRAVHEPVVDIVIDPTSDNSSSAATLIENCLVYAAQRNGTSRLWVLSGPTAADVTLVGSASAPKINHVGGDRAVQARIHRWAADKSRAWMSTAEPHFESNPRTGSPLLEALSVIAMSRKAHTRDTLVLLTDGRPVSSVSGNWECNVPADPKNLFKALDQARVFRPGSFSEAQVHFAHLQISHVENRQCPSSVRDEEARRELWRTLFARAGAASVEFHVGMPRLSQEKAQ